MLKVVDKRHRQPMPMPQLKHLEANETFVFVMDGQENLDFEAPHRKLHQNSNYLGTNNRHAPRRQYVLNMVTGKIHHRDMYSPVRRVDVQVSVFHDGELER